MAPEDKIRVLLVDDSALVRRVVGAMIDAEPDLELVGSEANGKLALEACDRVDPDIVILDVEMPEMNGVDTVAILRARYPRLPVIMFSAYTQEGAAITIEALTRGAADFVTKPSQEGPAGMSLAKVRDTLLAKIRGLARSGRKRTKIERVTTVEPVAVTPPKGDAGTVQIVCMAVSTGGPSALETVLAALPANFPVPIVVVQHMPATFTCHLAKRLASRCSLEVSEARDAEIPRPGTVIIAPGDVHLLLKKTTNVVRLLTNREAPENACRPSADVLFRSAAAAYGSATLAVVLTGMGQDGLAGCRQIRQAGGQIVVQDEASSVVWGMPGAVARAGLADRVLPIDQIAADVIHRVMGN